MKNDLAIPAYLPYFPPNYTIVRLTLSGFWFPFYSQILLHWTPGSELQTLKSIQFDLSLWTSKFIKVHKMNADSQSRSSIRVKGRWPALLFKVYWTRLLRLNYPTWFTSIRTLVRAFNLEAFGKIAMKSIAMDTIHWIVFIGYYIISLWMLTEHCAFIFYWPAFNWCIEF